MGSAASALVFDQTVFVKLKETYELKVKEGLDDKALYDFMKSYISQMPNSENILQNDHPINNITTEIAKMTKLKLYLQPTHKLCEIKLLCVEFFKIEGSKREWTNLTIREDFEPVVTTNQNFDSLLVPEHFYGRRPTDVFYANDKILLRTHMTAHLSESLKSGLHYFINVGEVFRRADVDDFHSEFFHQLELVCIFPSSSSAASDLEAGHKAISEALVKSILPTTKMRWEEAEEVSYIEGTLLELQIQFNGHPLDIVHSGILSNELLVSLGCPDMVGFVITVGLDHLAMAKYNIPKISDLLIP